MAVAVRGKGLRARFTLGSLVLHALLLTFAATRRPALTQVSASVAKSEVEIDVVEDAVVPASEEARASSEAVADDQRRAARVGVARRDAVQVVEPTSEESAPSEGDDGAAVGETAQAPSTTASDVAPHLSLTELGVDGKNPFLDRGDPAAARAAKAARVKKRLDRALAQGLTNQDTARGRGAGGPVLRAIEALVYGSTAPLNGNASFTLVIDSDGKLLSSTLGQANGDREAWGRVARETAHALAGRKLVVPKGRSVRVTVAVTSHLELPSGADPGLEVDAFGIPLKKGGGPRSTKLDILNPKHPLSTIGLDGDPADIGAVARRMVHAQVVSEELL